MRVPHRRSDVSSARTRTASPVGSGYTLRQKRLCGERALRHGVLLFSFPLELFSTRSWTTARVCSGVMVSSKSAIAISCPSIVATTSSIVSFPSQHQVTQSSTASCRKYARNPMKRTTERSVMKARDTPATVRFRTTECQKKKFYLFEGDQRQ